ncbi:MAG TPA: lamin tail domain-containing protein [Polyangiaceae bacterium]|nr:lamin tail domain-containing protein [Polyangiaceae bacterium]
MRTLLCRSGLRALVLVALFAACSRLPPLPEQRPPLDGVAGRGGGGGGGQGAGGAGHVVELVTYPATQAGRAPRVAQFELRPVPGQSVEAASVVLVRGEVSDVALRGLAKGEPPKSLLDRAVPSLVVRLEGGALVVAPKAPLAEGAYTLAAGSALFREGLEVVGDGLPIARRLWPPASGGAARFGVYCADEALPAGLRAEPGPALGPHELRPGVVDDARVGACVTLVLGEGAGAAVPPPPRVLAGEVPVAFLEPTPLTPGPGGAPGPSPARCAPPAVALGPICCEALDDRLVLRPGPSPVLALVEAGASLAARAFVDAPAVLRGLAPSTTARVVARYYDAAGAPGEASIEVTTAPARPHVVINEVLADALGPEPASEWVELVNDGGDAVELEGFRLADGGGEVGLPAHRLGPGEFVLLTPEGFVPGAGGDVAPAPSAARLTLPALGKSGLSNAGEALALRAPGGEIVSRFPALPRPKPGASVARRRPEVPDDDAGGFVVSAPGASTPGGPNAGPEAGGGW